MNSFKKDDKIIVYHTTIRNGAVADAGFGIMGTESIKGDSERVVMSFEAKVTDTSGDLVEVLPPVCEIKTPQWFHHMQCRIVKA